MKVYIVVSNGAMGGCTPDAVFSTKEKAEQYVSEYRKLYLSTYKPSVDRELHNIEEMTVDTAVPEV